MRHLIAFLTSLCLPMDSAGYADKLTAEETKALLFEGPWQIEVGVSVNYFVWNANGTLCVKLFDPQADTCDDTGSWFMNGTIVCYRLNWWGKTDNQRQGCFQILEIEPGIFETLDAGSLPSLRFTVVQTI